MNRATALCLAAVCFLSAGSAIHADQISYSISANTPSIFIQNGTLGGIKVDGSGSLGSGGSISANVTAFSFASPLLPQTLSNVPINLTLTDTTTGGPPVTLTLGTISGQMSLLGSSLSFSAATLPTLQFGGTNWNIASLGSAFSSGILLSNGSLSFSVTDPPINPPTNPPGGGSIASTGGSSPSAAPEPSSFVLAGIGVPILGIFLRRRRRA